mmetsp:Transcript_89920/g.254321  ORF Transcript_89920/g.254321 Transcript_89920/m.254321 type:complete len:260 (-) Transcript_89920:1923-2702(-)
MRNLRTGHTSPGGSLCAPGLTRIPADTKNNSASPCGATSRRLAAGGIDCRTRKLEIHIAGLACETPGGCALDTHVDVEDLSMRPARERRRSCANLASPQHRQLPSRSSPCSLSLPSLVSPPLLVPAPLEPSESERPPEEPPVEDLPPFLVPPLLPIRFMAFAIIFSIRLKRSTSSLACSPSSGHCASTDVEPPKRWIVSTVVIFALAGSRTWMPPAKPMSPSPNSIRSSNFKLLTNLLQRLSVTTNMASATILPRFRRA